MLNYDLRSKEHESDSPEYDMHGNVLSPNPFPGLRPFSINECHLFFGREGQVDEVLLKLAENRFVTVMGYSGSGKSSLMYCGLIPVLYGGFMTDAGANWNVVMTRPGVSPIDNLASSLISSDPTSDDYTAEELMVNQTVVSSLLRSNTHGLVEAIEKRFKKYGENTLILVDQFEELFRHGDNHNLYEESRAYVNLLLDACKSANAPVYVAITMRSDYIGECAKFPGLTQLINQSNYLVPQMTREQKRVAIEGPIAVGGGKVTKRLIKRLLNEIGDNQDQLPILQHALMRTWDYWIRNRDEDEPIDIRHYNAVGKISEALSQHANEAYDELSPKEKEIAEVLFKALTEKTSDSFGLRRPARLGYVAEIANVNEEEVAAVVEKFRQPGRSFLMPPANVELNQDSIIEISHESLMRIWIRLKAWVDEEYESAQMYRRLSEAAAMYQIGRTGLWRPPDLQLALNWQKKQKPTRAWAQRYDEAFERAIVFLDTSRITYEAEQKNQEMLQKRLLKRTKIVAVVLGIAAVISILFFVYAITQNLEAQRNLVTAQEQRAIAEEQRTLAQQRQVEAEEAAEEAERQRKIAEDASKRMRAALDDANKQRIIAQQQFEIANEQRDIAEGQKIAAQEAKNIAEQEYDRAEKNYNLANKLLYQSVAQSMAVKSLNIEEDNLKALLAQQAYLFNKNYEGRTYDPYIYDGLYYATDQLLGKPYSTLPIKHRNSIRTLVFAHSGDQFYTTGTAGVIKKSNLSSPDQVVDILSNNHPNRVLDVSFDDQWVVNASDSSSIQVVNVNDLSTFTIKGHQSFVNDVKFIPGTSQFISVGGDKQIRLNDIMSKESELIKSTTYEFKAISISPNGELIAGGTLSGQAIIMSVNGQNENTIVNVPGSPIHAVEFSPDGKLLVVGDEKGIVRVWNIAQNKVVYEFTAHKGRVSDIEFNKSGSLMATASLDRTIQMWVMSKLEELPISMTDNDAYIWDIEFSPDSNYILAACGDGEIRRWPTNPELMARDMCKMLERNLTEEEWKTYVGNDLEFENTCINLLLEDY